LDFKIAWGITGSGDCMPQIVKEIKGIVQQNQEIKIYIFLSKAAQQVIGWYGLSKDLGAISGKIFYEVDSNTTRPYYYLPGALQLRKFGLFLVCPATANTVAKIVNGIADTLITNSVAQATKAGIPIYIFPVDYEKGSQTTILPDGSKLELIMREIDLENSRRLSKMKNVNVFTNTSMLKEILSSH
jgi:archaeoflavoprotein AfpA